MDEYRKADLIESVVRGVGSTKDGRADCVLGSPFAEGAVFAVELGYLSAVDLSVVELTDKGRRLLFERDPVGHVLPEIQIKRYIAKQGLRDASFYLPV